MRKLIPLLLFLAAVLLVKAEDYVESYNIVSPDYVAAVSENVEVRTIFGGSIISPIFDESCPEEIKGPFEYACKILEEYMPPCLPLQVQVSCAKMSASQSSTISKVKARCKENFGNSEEYKNAPMSMIKGVVLAEMSYGYSVTYLDSIPDVEFFTEYPDIEITYNADMIDEISFSLDPAPEDKYDFVSVALRDLVKGLGISSSFKFNPITMGLDYPSQEMTPFECYISKYFEDCEDSAARLAKATQGELELENSFKLYAPSPWVNGVSLNYFVPWGSGSYAGLTSVLAYNFGKGSVNRAINDGASEFIFKDLLGWKHDIVTGIGISTPTSKGSTSILVPYNDSITISSSKLSPSALYAPSTIKKATSDSNAAEIKAYLKLFHPFLAEGDSFGGRAGVSICILKKDGTWDLVAFQPYYFGGDISLNMNEWTFNYTNAEYARTIDGYLRARVTTSQINNYGKYEYDSTYFVVDYLPQQIGLSYSIPSDTSTASDLKAASTSASTQQNVRLYFTNLEGINKVVLERLRSGARLPTKVQITDFRSGYYDTTIDRKTTFTVVGYNDNGYTKSLPVTIEMVSNAAEISVSMSQDKLYIDDGEDSETALNYTITSLVTNSQIKGVTDNYIDVADLPSGIYVLTLYSSDNETLYTYKFKK